MKTQQDIKFTIYGTARPAGSKHPMPIHKGGKPGTKGPIVACRCIEDSGENGKAWRSTIAAAARAAYRGPLIRDQPLLVRFVFYVPRNKGHFGTGKNADKLKASAPQFPITRPDVLKLTRMTEDACTGVIWYDDAQIVDEILAKRYGEPARCEVLIRRL